MKRNRVIWGLLAGVAAVALMVGGTAVASNMGFKFVPNIGANEFFNLSLPWFNNYTKANELFNDLPGASRISKINPNGSRTSWFNGASFTQNFDVIKAEGYVVEAGGSGVNSAVIVGSHDPNFTLTFNAGEFFNAAAPYHQTFTKANELFNDMNAQMGATAIARISKINANGAQTSWFNGASFSQNFTLDLGMAVIVESQDGGSGYVWPHY
ncbi:MAG: hypothetical protein Kow0062_26930 [Acidobacteriota bacterium]